MSYEIEYGRKCYKMPAGTTEGTGTSLRVPHQRSDDDLFLFIRSGCNNVSPRPKTWRLVSHGWNYSVIQEVCLIAGYTEGGMLKLSTGLGVRDVSPEDYLALYRKTIAEATELTVERLQRDLGITHLGFTWLDPAKVDALAGYARTQYESVIATFGEREENYSKKFEFWRPLVTLDDFFAWLEGQWAVKQMEGCHSIRSTQHR